MGRGLINIRGGQTCKRMLELELKDKAAGQWSKEPYIRRIVGGRDDSRVDLQKGMTYAFVLEFESEADRAYCLEGDPVVRAFRESVEDLVGEIQVLEFQPGDWGVRMGNARGGGF
ncbi:hypothetical protein BJ875DRAFT_365186 [Amylocarpus encephaloides]|uniref:Stress-response A/B barrel domain-containing protein n=1 Tax=Amylocarpus encephaloides TaxID=45428 RepID=A0A9P8CAM4_9HELO|nr:hypothetical protein BJ875DRAFT_365186 [Amylocarpus encephaloides]